jgi:hypothetical protein
MPITNCDLSYIYIYKILNSMEIYKIIENYSNYSISNYGNVKNNKTGKLLKIRKNYGYNRVRLYNQYGGSNFSVHRLVGEYFIPKNDERDIINHIDGDKLNNHFANLEWVSNSENVLHRMYILGKGIKKIGLIKNNIEFYFDSLAQASRELNLCHGALSRLASGEYKTHKGYKLIKTL